MDLRYALDLLFVMWPAVLAGAACGVFEVIRFRRWLKLTKRPCNVWGLRIGRFPEWKGAEGIPIYFMLIYLIIAVALSVLSYMLAPKPKAPKPDANADLQDPVAEAGMPVPTVFGTIMVKGLNCLWYGDKRKRRYKVKP